MYMLILVGLLPKLLTCVSDAPRQVAAVATSPKTFRRNMMNDWQQEIMGIELARYMLEIVVWHIGHCGFDIYT